MDFHDGVAEGADIRHHLPVVQPAFPSDLFPQGHSLYIFHHDISSSVFFKKIPDCYNPFRVFLIKHGQDPGLPQKSAAAGSEQALFPGDCQDQSAFPVPLVHRLQKKLLHGHPYLQLQVQSQIGNPEAAPAQDPSGQISAGQKAARCQAVFRRFPQRRIITAECTGSSRIGPFFHTARTYFLIIHFFPLLFCHMRITPFFLPVFFTGTIQSSCIGSSPGSFCPFVSILPGASRSTGSGSSPGSFCSSVSIFPAASRSAGSGSSADHS